ncbi:hypothetical protein AAVH_09077 [Aphelenchoides avenae]|nr:hypothetical protein AAVH_09077 [Aphelenchus avenae]
MRYYDDGLQNVKKMKTIYSLSLRFQILENFVRRLYVLVAVLSATTAAPLVIAIIVEDEVIVVLSAEAFAMGIVM